MKFSMILLGNETLALEKCVKKGLATKNQISRPQESLSPYMQEIRCFFHMNVLLGGFQVWECF